MKGIFKMIRSTLSKNKMLPFIILYTIFCLFSGFLPASYGAATAGNSTAGQQDVVAKIGDYTVTKVELLNSLIAALAPKEYTDYNKPVKPEDANSMLMRLLGEKAMVIQARKDGYQNDPMIQMEATLFRNQRLANMLVGNYIQGKINITDDEIKKKMQADPNLDQNRAKSAITVEKATTLVDDYYKQIYEKLHVKKLTENYPKVVAAYKKLTENAQKNPVSKYIIYEQVGKDLTAEERSTPLLTFDNGKVTLEDWFTAICQVVPPGRPDLTKQPEKVEEFLNEVAKIPVFVGEAQLQGLDKNEQLKKLLRDYEDMMILGKIQQEKYTTVKEPTQEQMAAYFEKNNEVFRGGRSLNVEQIWFKDMNDVRLAQAELDNGNDFGRVREKYSLDKDTGSAGLTASSEGMFWPELWKGQTGKVIGPVKGFFNGQLKWRLVKILAKSRGELPTYSTDMNNLIKAIMMGNQLESVFISYGNELLKKYQYEIYKDKVKDINPLNIP
jgi:hypothetical protein